MNKYVKYATKGCGQCMALDQILKSLGVEKEVKTILLDEVADAEEHIERYSIRRVPVLLKLDENGSEVDRITGLVPLPEYRKFFFTK